MDLSHVKEQRFGLHQSTPGKLKSPSMIILGSGEFKEKK